MVKLVIIGSRSIDWHFWFEYYDGWLFWKVSPSRNVKVGDLAGSQSSEGYWQVRLQGRSYTLSRVIWEMHNGPIEDGLEIDHEDRNKNNNHIENLRKVTHSINNHNRIVPNKNGLPGVYMEGDTFVVRIQHLGVRRYVGRFATAEEASAAYETAKSKMLEVH